MWSPTHVQVVVQKARHLAVKGKNGTNDAFVTIQLGKEKFQTSVKGKTDVPEWNEECELTIPDGNTTSIVLTVLHRNFIGLDKFIGRVQIPLNELEIYERSRSRWYTLEGKPGKSSTKKRGDLEVRISFTVKSVTGSLMDLSKKPKKSNSLPLKMVQSVGGSLMNLASKDKKLGRLPFKLSNYGHKLSEKLPIKSKSHRSTGKIDELTSEGDLEDDRFSQMSSYNSDEEISSIAENSPSSTRTDIPQPEKSQRNKIKDGRDEWETKLLGIPSQETDRRFSVPALIELTESPSEGNLADIPLPEPQMKPRIGRNNVRRHTIQGIRSTKSVPEIEKPAVPKHLPIDSIQEVEATDSAVIPTPSPSKMSSAPVVVQSARQHSRQNALTTRVSDAKQRSLSSSSLGEDATNKIEVPISPMKINSYNAPLFADKNGMEKLSTKNSRLLSNLSKDKVEMFDKMSKEDLVELIICQQSSIDLHLKQIRDLEDYIDNLLVRVMETTPRILQKSYKIAPSVRKLVSLYRNELGVEESKPRIIRPCHYL